MSGFLEGLDPASDPSTPMEKAVERQIEWLTGQGKLDESHTIVVALIRELADVIGKSAGRGRGSSVALASKELREALLLLPVVDGEADPWTELQNDIQAAQEAAKIRATGAAR